MPERRRVVVTGLGALTPLGNTAEELWAGLTEGRSGIGPITKFDAHERDASGNFRFPTRIAGEVRNFDPLRFVDKKEARRLDPYLQYAVACSVMAVEDAGLDPGRVDAARFGVIIGSGIGGIQTLLEGQETIRDKGPERVSPFLIPMLIINMASGLVSMRFGARGPNSAVVTACATGNHAIGDAFKIIQRGDADVMIAGGAEAIIVPLTIAGFTGGQGPDWLNAITAQLSHGSLLYITLYVALIVFFAFFYTAIVFNPVETADNLKKYGGFVPGIRPGKNTADYLDYVLTRLTVIGAAYLSAVCILPEILISQYSVPFYFGGTSLLIVVSVTMDTVAQVHSHLLAHQYEGLIKKAKLRGARR